MNLRGPFQLMKAAKGIFFQERYIVVLGGRLWQQIYSQEFIALFVAVETREQDLGVLRDIIVV